MEYEVEDDVLGRVPKFGAIFMCNLSTKRECFRRKLLGLPSAKANFVRQIKAGMLLFLFEFERRELYGVFRACSDGSMNIVPHAFTSSGKQFPAQVRFTPVWYCNPLCEDEFQDAIIDNYFSKKKFNFGLSEEQVHRLLRLFSSRKMEKPPRPSGRQTSQPIVKGKRITGNDNVFLSNNRAEKFDEEDSLDSVIHTKYPGNSSSKSGRLDGDRFLKSGGTENDLNVNNSHGYDILTKQLSASLGKRRRDDDDKVSMQDRIAYDRHLDHGLVQVVPIDHPGDSLGKPERVAEERKFLLSDRVETSHSVDSNTGPTVRPKYFWDSLTKVRRPTDDDRFSIRDIVGDERTSDTTIGLITSTDHFENPAIKAGIPSDDRRFLNDYRVESRYNLDNFPKPVVSADYRVNHSGKRRTSDDGVLFSNGRTEIEQHVDNCSRLVISAKYLEKGMGKVRKEIEDDKFLTSVRVDSPSEPFANRLDYVRRANDNDRFLARVSRENEHNVDNGVGPVISTLHSPYPSDEVRLVADDLLKIGREHNMENSYSLPMSNNLCQSRQNPSFYSNNPVLETDYSLCQDQPKPRSAIPSAIASMEQNTFDFSYPTSRDAGVTRTVPHYPEVPDINHIRSSSVAVGCTSCSVQDFPPHLSSTGNLFAASSERSSPYRFEAQALSRHLDVASGFADEVPLPTTPNHYTGSDFRTSSSLLSAEYHQKLNPTFLEFDNHAVVSQGRHENKISHHDTSQAFSIDNASFNSNMGYLHSGSSHEKSNNHDSRYYESPKVMPTDPKSKRTSVFARLTAASEVSVKENDTDLQYDECDIGASVDQVMDTLYQSLSHRVMKAKKSSLVTKHDIEHDKLKMTTLKKKNDVDQVIEENCNDILKETRVVSFKRRSETKKNQDRTKAKTSVGTLEHETKGSVQKLECEGLEAKQHKRRKLVRPVFGKTEQLDEGLSSDGSPNLQPSHMDSFRKECWKLNVKSRDNQNRSSPNALSVQLTSPSNVNHDSVKPVSGRNESFHEGINSNSTSNFASIVS